jgi:hypothetical protein
MATTDNGSAGGYMDTLVYTNIDISYLDFSDTSNVIRFLFKIDTLEDTTIANGAQSWSDSGHIPDMVVEFRYILNLDPKAANDTICANGAGAGQWISILDTCPTIRDWGHVRVPLKQLGTKIDIRVRDKSNTRRKGNKHGKWFSSMLMGRIFLR